MNELLKDLWKDKPLLIAVVVGVGAIVYILIQNQQGSAVAAANTTNSSGTGTGTGSTQTYPVAPAATYVEEDYYNNVVNSNNPHTTTNTKTITKTSTSTSTQSVVPTPPKTIGTVLPAARGLLNNTNYSAGKGDTNFWVYTVPAGSTIASVTRFAKWGTATGQFVNYRNNAAVLKSVGVDINNPNAVIPAGTQVSV